MSTTDNERLLKQATAASVAVASVLVVAKLGAWFFTGSVSLLASLVDSSMDVVASAVNLMAVRYSLQPPDEEHRFGHGKAEALAGLAQSTFVFGSALFLILHAIERLFVPQPLTNHGVGIGVMLLSIVLTIGLLVIQRRAIAQTRSTAIRADALHYVTDLATNGVTLLALVLAYYGVFGADPVLALGIAAFIVFGAAHIGRDSIHLLMDRELPDDEREAIKAVAEQTPGVLGVHKLRTWQSGQRKVIQLDLEMDRNNALWQAHAIGQNVEMSILALEPTADITIHHDPVYTLS